MTHFAPETVGVEPTDQRRLAVVCRGIRVDVTLPAHLELVAILPDLVELVRDHVRRGLGPGSLADPDEHMGAGDSGSWRLARLDGDPLELSETLARQRVADGEILVLDRRKVASPPPLVDDLVSGLVDASAAAGPGWGRREHHTAALATVWLLWPLAAAAVLAARLAGGADSGLTPALLAALLTVLALAGAVACRLVAERGPVTTTADCALTTLAGLASAAAVPGPLAAGHAVAGCAVAALAATLVHLSTPPPARSAGPQWAVSLGLAVAAGGGTIAALVALVADLPLAAVGAGATIAGLLGLVSAPHLSVPLGRITLPAVPGVDSDSPDDPAAAEPRFLPDPEVVAGQARAAAAALAGLLGGCGAIAVTGALVALTARNVPAAAGAGLTTALAVVLTLRAFTFAGRWPTVLHLAGALVLVAGMLVGNLLVAPDRPTGVVFGALGVGSAATALAVVAPRIELSPLTRSALGVVESLLIAAIVPLAFWITGIYGLVASR